MGPFAWGIVLGLLIGAAVTSAASLYARRRFLAAEYRARQAQRLAELGMLTSALAHEIKNPLSTVQLNLRLLQEDLEPDHPAHGRLVNRLNIVQRETSRLRDILDDFLRYAGKLEIERAPVDLNQLLEELVDFFMPQAQVNRVQVRFKPADKPILAQVDAKLIKQAVLNLMLNAVQAMSASGGELILRAASPDGDKHAAIDVIDTGPGIPPESREKIFEAYYSTKRTGTGLGLAMARRIIEEHGGRIEVKSEVGKGTDFQLILPR